MFGMNQIYKYSIFWLMFMIPLLIIGQDEDTREWKLKKEKNGIQIHTRLMEGSKFKEYKSRCEVTATPEELVNILMDVESYPDWMAFVIAADILEMDGENIFYVYSEVKVPWPFDNRDQVTKSVVSKDSVTGVIAVDVSIVPDYLPEKDGIVRLPEGRGAWIFTPLENGKTEAYHQFGGDPGGNIPAWIVNMFLVDGPYKTIMGLQEQVALEKSSLE